jgi:hypothetical protein
LIQKLKLHHRESAAECFAKSPQFGAVHVLFTWKRGRVGTPLMRLFVRLSQLKGFQNFEK